MADRSPIEVPIDPTSAAGLKASLPRIFRRERRLQDAIYPALWLACAGSLEALMRPWDLPGPQRIAMLAFIALPILSVGILLRVLESEPIVTLEVQRGRVRVRGATHADHDLGDLDIRTEGSLLVIGGTHLHTRASAEEVAELANWLRTAVDAHGSPSEAPPQLATLREHR